MSGQSSFPAQVRSPTEIRRFLVVGLGELLWDLLPQGKHLGGAPANFAYISSLLGDHGVIASRIGSDDLGREAVSLLQSRGLDTSSVQCDSEHPTGVANVCLDSSGQPRFEIAPDSAWDFLEWTPAWQALAARVDAVCFGSLAQRSSISRSTVVSFLEHTPPDCVRVFDVNLRQSYFSADVLRRSLQLATVAKLNEGELAAVLELLGLTCRDLLHGAQTLREAFSLRLVCVTRGEKGSLLVSPTGADDHPGVPVRVADTIGSGDAFTAGMLHAYGRSRPLNIINRAANIVGSWVASRSGAMPPADPTLVDNLQSLLAEQAPSKHL